MQSPGTGQLEQESALGGGLGTSAVLASVLARISGLVCVVGRSQSLIELTELSHQGIVWGEGLAVILY